MQLFFSDQNLTSNLELQLDEETSKHIIQVLRMKRGEKIQLTDGKGKIAEALIVDDHKKKSIVQVREVMLREASSTTSCIAISILKNTNRFEWFLEKATEIGVSAIIPMICERTEKQHFRLDRMRNILVSAMLQSQQAWLPELLEPVQFSKLIDEAGIESNCNSFFINHPSQKFIAHCIAEEKRDLRTITDHASNKIILIGPEGDFTKNEIDLALKNSYIPVSLGNTRLRSETAGVVAAAYLV